MTLAALSAGVLAIGGYFESHPYALHWPTPRAHRYPLVAVYWSGDMGIRLGYGARIIETMRMHGIPVLSVSSPMLFGRQRDIQFVDQAMATSLVTALTAGKADRIAVIGSSFGADIVGSALGRVEPEIRKRVASVVLVAPGTDVYFRANPSGIFYRGPSASDPVHDIPLLRGLPVTCIFGTGEDDSLCRRPVMARAHDVAIDGGHAMLFSHAELTAAVEAAVVHPPIPMR